MTMRDVARPHGPSRTLRIRGLAFGLAVLVLRVGPAVGAGPANLVANGDFSDLADGKPVHWQTSGDEKEVTQSLRTVEDGQGRPCAELACNCAATSGPRGARHAGPVWVGDAGERPPLRVLLSGPRRRPGLPRRVRRDPRHQDLDRLRPGRRDPPRRPVEHFPPRVPGHAGCRARGEAAVLVHPDRNALPG